jgi:hypothetical protein
VRGVDGGDSRSAAEGGRRRSGTVRLTAVEKRAGQRQDGEHNEEDNLALASTGRSKRIRDASWRRMWGETVGGSELAA